MLGGFLAFPGHFGYISPIPIDSGAFWIYFASGILGVFVSGILGGILKHFGQAVRGSGQIQNYVERPKMQANLRRICQNSSTFSPGPPILLGVWNTAAIFD